MPSIDVRYRSGGPPRVAWDLYICFPSVVVSAGLCCEHGYAAPLQLCTTLHMRRVHHPGQIAARMVVERYMDHRGTECTTNADRIRQLEAEGDQQRARLAMCESLELLPGRPVLDVPEYMLTGYPVLDGGERAFTTVALSEYREFVLLWYRYFNLLAEALLGEGSPRDGSD